MPFVLPECVPTFKSSSPFHMDTISELNLHTHTNIKKSGDSPEMASRERDERVKW